MEEDEEGKEIEGCGKKQTGQIKGKREKTTMYEIKIKEFYDMKLSSKWDVYNSDTADGLKEIMKVIYKEEHFSLMPVKAIDNFSRRYEVYERKSNELKYLVEIRQLS